MWYLSIFMLILEVSGGEDAWTGKIFNMTTYNSLENPGSMMINGRTFKSYKKTYKLRYFPGELMKVYCLPSTDWFVYKLKYYEKNIHNSNVDVLAETSHTTLYRKMKDDPDTSKHFCCELLYMDTKVGVLRRRIRIHAEFTQRENDFDITDGPMFLVNDLILQPRAELGVYDENNLNFLYEYYEGEELNVNLISKTAYFFTSTCTFVGDNPPRNLRGVSITIKFTFEEKHENTKVFCKVFDAHNYVKTNMTLVFVRDSFKYEPFIESLSLSKTLLKYKVNSTLTIIRYEYTSEKGLTLNCSSDSSQPTFWFDDGAYETWTAHNQDGKIYHEVGHFHFHPHAKRAKITCSSLIHGTEYVTRLSIYRINSNGRYVDSLDKIPIDYIQNQSKTKTTSKPIVAKAVSIPISSPSNHYENYIENESETINTSKAIVTKAVSIPTSSPSNHYENYIQNQSKTKTTSKPIVAKAVSIPISSPSNHYENYIENESETINTSKAIVTKAVSIPTSSPSNHYENYIQNQSKTKTTSKPIVAKAVSIPISSPSNHYENYIQNENKTKTTSKTIVIKTVSYPTSSHSNHIENYIENESETINTSKAIVTKTVSYPTSSPSDHFKYYIQNESKTEDKIEQENWEAISRRSNVSIILIIVIVLPCIIIIIITAIVCHRVNVRARNKTTNRTYENVAAQQCSDNVDAVTGYQQGNSSPELLYDYTDAVSPAKNKITNSTFKNDVTQQCSDNVVAVTGYQQDKSIPEPLYDYPFAVSHLSGSGRSEMDISKRPPYPLPVEEREEGRPEGKEKSYVHYDTPHVFETRPTEEEDKPYIHYDTPYEFRIFRMGFPVARIPDRFAGKCHKPKRFS